MRHRNLHRPRDAVQTGRVNTPRAPQLRPMTVIVTPRPPSPPPTLYTLPTVRELPPVSGPGSFDSTW